MVDHSVSIVRRLSPLQRAGVTAVVVLVLLGIAGYLSIQVVTEEEKPFYTPGVIPSRQDCFYEKIGRFNKLNKQILFQAAQECELEVQSIEGHEQKRLEWLEKQAEAARQRKLAPQPAAKPEEPPAPVEMDRVRRVWN